MSQQRQNKRAKELKKVLREMLPLCTLDEFNQIVEIGIAGHLRHLPASIAAWQATTSFVRHNFSDYDTLLAEGYDVESARHFVLDDINTKLMGMGCTRQLSNDEDVSSVTTV